MHERVLASNVQMKQWQFAKQVPRDSFGQSQETKTIK